MKNSKNVYFFPKSRENFLRYRFSSQNTPKEQAPPPHPLRNIWTIYIPVDNIYISQWDVLDVVVVVNVVKIVVVVRIFVAVVIMGLVKVNKV